MVARNLLSIAWYLTLPFFSILACACYVVALIVALAWLALGVGLIISAFASIIGALMWGWAGLAVIAALFESEVFIIGHDTATSLFDYWKDVRKKILYYKSPDPLY
jgi:hypothetical protein